MAIDTVIDRRMAEAEGRRMMELSKVERMADGRVKVEVILPMMAGDKLMDKIRGLWVERPVVHSGPDKSRCPTCVSR